MGQEESTMLDDSVLPETLSERTLSAVAEYIKSGKVKRIVVMAGAGISTAAGIPDFRSPKTGLYNNLARLDLPYAEAVFEIDYFRKSPEPFYVLAKELYPGQFQPTVSHVFLALLAKKGLLQMLFTQNIDCLERAAGVPPEKIIEAHGSFATQRCIECKTEFPDKDMKEHVHRGDVPRCRRSSCGGLVKPDIVFFGEALPRSFTQNTFQAAMADLALVIGTSLQVYPFAGLPQSVMQSKPRVLFNMERVGSMGSRPDDVLVLGPCDIGIRRLADELGWRDELEKMWRDVVGDEEADRQLSSQKQHEQDIEDEVNKLTEDVEGVLKLQDDGEDTKGTASEQDGPSSGDRRSPSEEISGSADGTTCPEKKPDESKSTELATETKSNESDGKDETLREPKDIGGDLKTAAVPGDSSPAAVEEDSRRQDALGGEHGTRESKLT